MRSVSFASLAYENKKKKTRREKFLEEMEQAIPWEKLLQVVRKHYPIAAPNSILTFREVQNI